MVNVHDPEALNQHALMASAPLTVFLQMPKLSWHGEADGDMDVLKDTKMRIKFRIVERKFPRHARDFTDYCIASVVVVECDKQELVGRTMTWKGKLPACVPYALYACDSGIYEDEPGVSLTCGKSTTVCCENPSVMPTDGLVFMIEQELGQRASATAEDVLCSRIVTQMLRGKIAARPLVAARTGCEALIEGVPCMFDVVANDTLYYRAGMLQDVRKVYGEGTQKIQKTLRYDLLKRLWQDLGFPLNGGAASGAPIESLFPLLGRNNAYKTKPLTYGQFIKCPAASGAAPFQTLGVRILDCYRKLGQHTGHAFDYLHKRFTQEHPIDRGSYERSFWWLVNTVKALVWVRDAVMVSETHTHRRATEIVNLLSALFERFDPEKSEGLLRPVDAPVPCIPPPHLTDEQTLACLHMLNNPFTMVCGPPGRGKTTILEVKNPQPRSGYGFFKRCSFSNLVQQVAVAYWKRVLGISFVGTNVASHRERCGGHAEISHTAHYVYYQSRSELGRQWLCQFDAVVWDEFANVDDALVAKTLASFPELQRFTTIMDPWQIHPLKQGLPALDLLEAFPECVFNLTINKRMEPNAREMGDAILHILKGKPEQIEWSHRLADFASMTMLPTKAGRASAAGFGGSNYGGRRSGNAAASSLCNDMADLELQRLMTSILQHVYNNPSVYNVRTILDVQFIAFRRAQRDKVNEIVERVGNAIGLIRREGNGYTVRKDLFLYQGCKICIRGDNFPARPDRQLDAIRNGEVGVITHISMVPDGSACLVSFRGSGEAAATKQMLLDRELHVDPASVHLGHAITANAAQGCEYQTVIGVLHDGCESEQWICRGHMYVMSSRAKRAFICANATEEQFNTICYRVEPRRSTILKPLLATVGRRPTVASKIPLRNHEEMTEMAKDVLCVPVLMGGGQEKKN